MDISFYFESLDIPEFKEGTLGSQTDFHTKDNFPDPIAGAVAVVGVAEDRGNEKNLGCAESANAIRNKLYNLFVHDEKIRLIDFGNIKAGATKTDTYHAVADVCQTLIKKNVLVVLIGGTHDLVYGNYLAYEKLEQTVNMVSLDSKFNLGENDGEISAASYLKEIILHQPNYLFNYSHVGYQTYMVARSELKLMNDLYFDCYRLGEIQSNLIAAEPILRNADMVGVDMSVVRNSDFTANRMASVNGFYGEEICQLMRYAGISDKLTSIGFYEYNCTLDKNGLGAELIAEMIWCLLDGFSNRKKDFPIGTKEKYTKYLVHLEGADHDLVFYKSDKSDRWWMDVPYPPQQRMKYERHHLVPCTYEQYQEACAQVVPDLWWKTYQKLN